MGSVIEQVIENIDQQPIQHLWEQCQNRSLSDFISGEIEYDHHHDKPYDSWDTFLKTNPHGCNCLYGNPIIYWFWREKGVYEIGENKPKSPEHLAEYEIDVDEEYEYYAVDEDLLTICYCPWSQPTMTKISINVTKADEPVVREFLKNEQSLRSVWQDL